MIFLTIVFVIQIGVSSVLLKAACWTYNYFFACFEPLPAVAVTTASSVTTETMGHDGASENERTNPFATPRQIAEPMAKNHERPIVALTLGLSISIGLLTGMLLFVFGFGLLGLLIVGCDVYWVIIAGGLALVVTFIVTAAFVSDSLTENFNRGAIVTGIYFALLLATAVPLIVLLLLSSGDAAVMLLPDFACSSSSEGC